jgi:hypothetical protein
MNFADYHVHSRKPLIARVRTDSGCEKLNKVSLFEMMLIATKTRNKE